MEHDYHLVGLQVGQDQIGETQSRIKDLGGRIASSVTKDTSYLVVGESPGSKLAAAERLGTEALEEEKFVSLVTNCGLATNEAEESRS